MTCSFSDAVLAGEGDDDDRASLIASLSVRP